MSDRCQVCRYYSGYFECRRHAPVRVEHENVLGIGRGWPSVQPTDWCGDFEIDRTKCQWCGALEGFVHKPECTKPKQNTHWPKDSIRWEAKY